MSTFQSPFHELYKALENAVENTVPKTKYLDLESRYKESITLNDRRLRTLGSALSEKETLNVRCKELELQLKENDKKYAELLRSYNELAGNTTEKSNKQKPKLNIIVKNEPVRMMNIPKSLPASSKSSIPEPTTARPPISKPSTSTSSTAAPIPGFKIPSNAPVVKKPPLKPPLKRSASQSHIKQNNPKMPKLAAPSFVCPDCYNDWYNAKSDFDRSQKGLVVRSFNSHRKLIVHIFENHPSTATWDTICPEPGCTDQKGHTNEPHGDQYKCKATDADGQTCGRTYQNRTDYRFHVNVEHANTAELNAKQLYALWHADY